MRFGKLENGRLISPPSMLQNVPRTFPPEEEGGEPITGLYQVGYDPEYTPDYVEAYFRENGYMPVYADRPPVDADPGKHWEQTGWVISQPYGEDAIVAMWAQVEDPDPEEQEISADEALDIIFGGDENAVD